MQARHSEATDLDHSTGRKKTLFGGIKLLGCLSGGREQQVAGKVLSVLRGVG